MKKLYSIKSKFITMYIFSFFIPIIITMFCISKYVEIQFTNQISILIDNTLASASDNISTYLGDLNRLTVIPYYDREFTRALNIKLQKDNYKFSDYEIFQANQALNTALPGYLMNTRKEILSTIIVTGSDFISGARKNGSLTIPKNYNFKENSWYKAAQNANGSPCVTGLHEQDYFSDSGSSSVFSVARLIKDPVTSQDLAVVMADANTNIFNDIFSKLKFNISSINILFDEAGNVLYSTDKVSQDIIKEINSNSMIKYNNTSYLVKTKKIDNYDWKIVMLVSYSGIHSEVLWIYKIFIIFILVSLFITYFIFNALSNNISSPIKKMRNVIKEVEKGNFDIRMSNVEIFEIGELSSALNNMIEKLKESIDKEYKLVIQQKNAEFKALQSQIHPHFLYNTLNGFIGLNRIGEKELLEKSILDLTGILRYALEDKNIVSIEAEFNSVSKYCNLQLLRFEDRMHINIYCADGIKGYYIPKFLLQPLVENAIIHGVEPTDKLCTISVNGKEENEFIVLTVTDDGVGFDTGLSREGIGVSNTKNRLLLFDANCKFHLESSPMKGTKIEIRIPKERLKSENSNF